MPFSRAGFLRLIAEMRAAGYRFTTFRDALGPNDLVLRHDVDFSVDIAHQLAVLEAELGVQSTYFFMLSGNGYNLLSPHSRGLVAEIRGMGHAVSLHFDPTAHADLDGGFEEERRAIEPLTGPIDIVSLHRPRDFLSDNNRRLAGVDHTYQDRYFRDMRYVSDSGGAFRFGHPLANRDDRPLHLLLHPINWLAEGACISDKLRAWQAAHLDFINRETMANCRTFDGRSCVEPRLDAVA